MDSEKGEARARGRWRECEGERGRWKECEGERGRWTAKGVRMERLVKKGGGTRFIDKHVFYAMSTLKSYRREWVWREKEREGEGGRGKEREGKR